MKRSLLSLIFFLGIVCPAMAADEPAAAPDIVQTSKRPAPVLNLTPEQQQALADEATVNDILIMFKDPEIVSLLTDRSLLEALRSGDRDLIENHPSFKKLNAHPKYKALIEKIEAEPDPL